jgi:hypothetical protein
VISTKILPKFFKDVLQHIPTIALKSLDWKGVFKEMGPMLLRLGKGPLGKSEKATLESFETQGVKIVTSLSSNRSSSQLSLDEKYLRGQKTLELYFQQFKNPNGACIDLRYKFFENNLTTIEWTPSNVWYEFSKEFRNALISIYKGFYFKDDEVFTSGLQQIGLTENLFPEKTQELKKLFFSHFGPGEQDVVKFEISQFSESFYELFHFFVENKVKLHKDFIFLGIYLVTLYLHLEDLDIELNPKEAFLKAFNQDT